MQPEYSTNRLNLYRHPLRFYLLATMIPWVCWFVAGYLSHLPGKSGLSDLMIPLLGLFGLSAPMLIALGLMRGDAALREDILRRLISLRGISPGLLVFAALFMLGSILAAQAVSLLFGYSSDQFRITGEFTFSSGVFPVWLLLVVAPTIEELGWHSYGTDCLRQRFNLLATSLIFALYWGLWHLPLSSIEGYYHSNVVETGWIHGVNFLVSIFPLVVIMNWLYYKTGRNILVTVIFHVTAGYFNEIFATHPDTKVIQTGLLTLFAILLVWHQRAMFFDPRRLH